MAQLYDHSLMLSIAIQNARFSLIVPFSHSELPKKALKRLIQTNLTLQVAHLAQGNLNLITNPQVCYPYPGAGRSLPILSSSSSNIALVTITSAS